MQREVHETAEVHSLDLPTGRVTFLFTDIEGSTQLLQSLGEAYVSVLQEHHRILRKAVAEQGGREIDNQGDSFFFAFERANAALGAAVLAQRALTEHPWPEEGEVRVRMGLHTGEPMVGEERYVGLGVHRAARIGAIAHGGQVLLSNATRELIEDGLAGVSIRDLGSYRLKDLDRDERLYQLDVAGLRSDFPPLKAQRVAEPRAVSQTEVEIGAEFLGYRIEELIGQGGMGVVYRAYDLRLKRTVALKLVTPELALDERFRERFARETELTMSLEHPNVVPIHDAGEVAGRLYLAMRLVPGTDLRRLLRSAGKLEPERTLAICRQIANALDAAHARALVHRDVKPSNVLLDESEHVYLADFGLTRRLEEQGSLAGEGRSIGTPAYLAPEQIEGKRVDGRADIYSLGCVLFECLTGQVPFPQGSRLAAAWAHLEEAPPKASELAELPSAIDPVLDRALAKEPAERFATCAELIDAAEGALGIRRQPSRRRRILLGAGVLVVLGALALALAIDGRSHDARATPRLYARKNTVTRVDPTTNTVTAVVGVGGSPTVAAAGGHSVWVYNKDEQTISEIDARTNRVLKETRVPSLPVDVSRLAGPVLAADASGSWFVNGSLGVASTRWRSVLTNVLSDGRGKHTYGLDLTPRGVAVGDGAVWVVGTGADDYEVQRINPATGRVTARTRFSASRPLDSIAFGYGAVWVVDSANATLYRINPRTGKRTGNLHFGTSRASRPEMMLRGGEIWVRLDGNPGSGARIDPSTMSIIGEDPCCTPDWGEDRGDLGALWWYTWQTGNLFRQEVAGGPIRTIHITKTPPDGGGPCLTSIAIGSGSLWLAAAPLPASAYTCPPG